MGRPIYFLTLLLGFFLAITQPLHTFAAQGATQIQLAGGQFDSNEESVYKLDPTRPDQLADSIRKLVVVENGDFMSWLAFASTLMPVKEQLSPGASKPHRESWVIWTLGVLMLMAGLIRANFPVIVDVFLKAYYDDLLLGQLTKEENIFRSWPFFFIYLISGLSVGLFIYLILQSGVVQQPVSSPGIRSFLLISLAVIILFSLKIAMLRILGFVFLIKKMVRKYGVVLILSYFNAAMIFLPIAFVISLLPYENVKWVLPVALAFVLIMLIYRTIKAIADLLNNYRFSKFYLFAYLCTLEIAPVLILIKIVYR